MYIRLISSISGKPKYTMAINPKRRRRAFLVRVLYSSAVSVGASRISRPKNSSAVDESLRLDPDSRMRPPSRFSRRFLLFDGFLAVRDGAPSCRSEERRVGKECGG